MAANQPATQFIQLVRNLATIKGIPILPTAQRPASLIDGPVTLVFQFGATAFPNNIVFGDSGPAARIQQYTNPTVIIGTKSEAPAVWTEIPQSDAGSLVFGGQYRSNATSYAGIIYGVSADFSSMVSTEETNIPQLMSQFWSGAALVIKTGSGRTSYTIPMRECSVVFPNAVASMAIDGNDTPESVNLIGATGACGHSGDPVYKILPAIPWTGQSGDDIQLVWGGPALEALTNWRLNVRIWTLAGQIQSANMQGNDDGGVSNLVPPGRRDCYDSGMLTDRQVESMIKTWRQMQAGQDVDEGA